MADSFKGRADRRRGDRRQGDRRQPEGAESLDHSAPIGDLIPEVLAGFGLESKLWLSELQKEWSALVGDSVAKHTRPGRLEKDCLIVFVDSSVWLHELSRYAETEMLTAVRNRFGAKVRSLSLRLDPDGRPET